MCVVAHTYNSCTLDAEMRESWVPSHPVLHSDTIWAHNKKTRKRGIFFKLKGKSSFSLKQQIYCNYKFKVYSLITTASLIYMQIYNIISIYIYINNWNTKYILNFSKISIAPPNNLSFSDVMVWVWSASHRLMCWKIFFLPQLAMLFWKMLEPLQWCLAPRIESLSWVNLEISNLTLPPSLCFLFWDCCCSFCTMMDCSFSNHGSKKPSKLFLIRHLVPAIKKGTNIPFFLLPS